MITKGNYIINKGLSEIRVKTDNNGNITIKSNDNGNVLITTKNYFIKESPRPKQGKNQMNKIKDTKHVNHSINCRSCQNLSIMIKA